LRGFSRLGTRISDLLGVKPGQLGGGRSKTRGVVDVAMLQTLAGKTDIGQLVGEYGLVVVDECHHIPAAAFEHAVKQIPARRWLGLTATPYRRDKLDDLIALQLGPTRHVIGHPTPVAPNADETAPRLELGSGRHRCSTCTRPDSVTPATPTSQHPAGWPPSTGTSSPTTPAPLRWSMTWRRR
jgi:hypothetical protein